MVRCRSVTPRAASGSLNPRRQQLLDRLLQPHRPALNLARQGDAGERLGDGPNLEKGVGSRRRARRQRWTTECHDRRVGGGDDCDGQADALALVNERGAVPSNQRLQSWRAPVAPFCRGLSLVADGNLRAPDTDQP